MNELKDYEKYMDAHFNESADCYELPTMQDLRNYQDMLDVDPFEQLAYGTKYKGKDVLVPMGKVYQSDPTRTIKEKHDE